MPGKLAATIRAKYPGVYDHVDDATLEAAIIAKYPQYAVLADDDTPPVTSAVNTPSKWRQTDHGFQDYGDAPSSATQVGDQMFQSLAHPETAGDFVGLLLPSELMASGIPAAIRNPVGEAARYAGQLVSKIPARSMASAPFRLIGSLAGKKPFNYAGGEIVSDAANGIANWIGKTVYPPTAQERAFAGTIGRTPQPEPSVTVNAPSTGTDQVGMMLDDARAARAAASAGSPHATHTQRPGPPPGPGGAAPPPPEATGPYGGSPNAQWSQKPAPPPPPAPEPTPAPPAGASPAAPAVTPEDLAATARRYPGMEPDALARLEQQLTGRTPSASAAEPPPVPATGSLRMADEVPPVAAPPVAEPTPAGTGAPETGAFRSQPEDIDALRQSVGAEKAGRVLGMTTDEVREAATAIGAGTNRGDASLVLPEPRLQKIIEALKQIERGSQQRFDYVDKTVNPKNWAQIETIRRVMEALGFIVPVATGVGAAGALREKVRGRLQEQN